MVRLLLLLFLHRCYVFYGHKSVLLRALCQPGSHSLIEITYFLFFICCTFETSVRNRCIQDEDLHMCTSKNECSRAIRSPDQTQMQLPSFILLAYFIFGLLYLSSDLFSSYVQHRGTDKYIVLNPTSRLGLIGTRYFVCTWPQPTPPRASQGRKESPPEYGSNRSRQDFPIVFDTSRCGLHQRLPQWPFKYRVMKFLSSRSLSHMGTCPFSLDYMICFDI